MKKVHFTFCFFALAFVLVAQNRVQLTHNTDLKSFLNPAFCGSEKALSVSVLARQQWIGYDNAPSSQILTFDTYLNRLKSGLGITIMTDRLGYENSVRLKVNYGYRHFVGRNTALSAGLGLGFLNAGFDASMLVYDEFDPGGIYVSASSYMPDIDAGIVLSHNRLNLGLSLSKTLDNLQDDIDIEIPFYLNFYTDYSFSFNDNLIFLPHAYWHKTIKISTINAGGVFVLSKKLHLGCSYRLKESLNGIFGYQISKILRLGYSYDFSIGGLKSYHSGSHEVLLKLTLEKKEKEYFYHKSPRFF